MSHTTFTAILAAVFLGLTACHPETVSSDTFEPEFRLMTDNFHGGEDFVFRIYSNHSAVQISKYDCEYGAENIVINRSYQVSDGYVEFRVTSVIVDETHRGRISLTVKDPDTGATKAFTGVYTAYVAFDNYVDITNQPATGSKLNYEVASLPAIVGGDDFTFVVHSNLEMLILKDFRCEFPTDALVRGNEYVFDKDGNISFKIPNVTIREDSMDIPSVLSLTFSDPVSGEEIVVSDEYIKLKKLEGSLRIESKTVVDGEEFKFRIYSSRKRYKITEMTFTPSSDAEDLEITLSSNQETNADGYRDYKSSSYATVSSSHSGSLKFIIEDEEYTGRKETLYDTYTAVVKPGASNISLSEDSILLCYDETKKVTISTTDTNTDGKYSFKWISGKGKANVTLEDNVLTISGTLDSGEAKIEVYSTNKPAVKATLKINVRKRVALQIEGTFYPFMQKSNTPSQPNFSNNRAEYVHNWHDAPSKMMISLVTWTSQGQLNKSDAYSKYHFDKITDSNCSLSADIYLEYTYGNQTSIYMFEGYRNAVDYESEHWTKEGYFGNNYYYQWTSTRKPGPLMVQHISNLSIVKEYSLGDLARYLQGYDDVMSVQKYNNFIFDGWSNMEHESDWTSFNVDIRNISYNQSLLDIRYVIYQYRAQEGSSYYSGKYWWSELDNSNDSWLVSVDTL